MNATQQKLVQILSQLDSDQRSRFVDRFNALAPEPVVKSVSAERRNCYTCGNRRRSLISWNSIEFDKCAVAPLVDDDLDYCESLLRNRPNIRTKCPEWRERVSVIQRAVRWFRMAVSR